MTMNALDALRHSGIIIASDTGEYLKIGEFFPQDATTNPSLVFTAISKPEYAHLTDAAVRYALSRPESLDLEARTELACDYLLVQVGVQILNIVPGRVSVSVDPRLANDKDAIVAKAHTLISLFEAQGYPRTRVLIKIPATYAGILASQALELTPASAASPPDGSSSGPIHTNATLVFGLVQALACAQAGVSVISPFVGRVKDWWDAQASNSSVSSSSSPSPLSASASRPQPASSHPGISLLHTIRTTFNMYGHTSRTGVMAAGFRAVEEVLEATRGGRGAGPDVVTLQVGLLEGLRGLMWEGEREREDDALSVNANGVDNARIPRLEPRYVVRGEEGRAEAEALFVRDLEKERIALEKVPEGLAKFAVDAKRMEDLLRELIKSRIETGGAL